MIKHVNFVELQNLMRQMVVEGTGWVVEIAEAPETSAVDRSTAVRQLKRWIPFIETTLADPLLSDDQRAMLLTARTLGTYPRPNGFQCSSMSDSLPNGVPSSLPTYVENS